MFRGNNSGCGGYPRPGWVIREAFCVPANSSANTHTHTHTHTHSYQGVPVFSFCGSGIRQQSRCSLVASLSSSSSSSPSVGVAVSRAVPNNRAGWMVFCLFETSCAKACDRGFLSVGGGVAGCAKGRKKLEDFLPQLPLQEGRAVVRTSDSYSHIPTPNFEA